MTSEQNIRTQFIDEKTQKRLMPRSYADNIIFNDGESLQYKYDNGKLAGNEDILNGLKNVSPEIEVIENNDDSYKLKIQSVSGVIITPNLKGEKGANSEDENSDVVPTFKFVFTSNDFKRSALSGYYLVIPRMLHKLGLEARIASVLRYVSEIDLANVNYTFNRRPNGDIVMLSGEPFDGIIYLEGDSLE